MTAIPVDRAVLRQVLEALEFLHSELTWAEKRYRDTAIDALRDALEQEEQEPVTWMSPASESMIGKTDENGSAYHIITTSKKTANNSVPLYTQPSRQRYNRYSNRKNILSRCKRCTKSNVSLQVRSDKFSA